MNCIVYSIFNNDTICYCPQMLDKGGVIMYKIAFYVPESHCETVKEALFHAGAGKFQHYDQVCWQVLGEGQFRPLAGSNPNIGNQEQLERLLEYRVEMICQEDRIERVVQALLQAHPYEAPAYEVIALAWPKST